MFIPEHRGHFDLALAGERAVLVDDDRHSACHTGCSHRRGACPSRITAVLFVGGTVTAGT